MYTLTRPKLLTIFCLLIILALACNFSIPGLMQGDRPSTQTAPAPRENTLPPEPPAAPLDTETPTPTGTDVPTETVTPTIAHLLTPIEPGANQESGMTDPDTSGVAAERRASRGESYNINLYERPFNADPMDIYYPDVDIQRAWLNRSGGWIFVTINVKGSRPGESALIGTYGIEIDVDRKGRGHYLIFASMPQPQWSVIGVEAWQDKNNDVGSATILRPDAPRAGDGFETQLFNQGVSADPDAAWARLAPNDPASVQIAFKHSLINNKQTFLWNAWSWAERQIVHPEWLDYHDRFTLAEAGSPLKEQTQYYPLKALAALDNTCRWYVGYTPTVTEPGMCALPPTPVPPTPTRRPTITPTPTRVIPH
ncbi:MAG: hypothetical protein U1B80_01435 [Anaerolineaceae bacterium]|nr:hypothetical protein [Anaerolineaceae bacterium]